MSYSKYAKFIDKWGATTYLRAAKHQQVRH